MIRSLDSGVKFHGCKVVIYYREVSLIQIEYFDNGIVFIFPSHTKAEFDDLVLSFFKVKLIRRLATLADSLA